ncbi:hypothetical protein WAI453_003915 [Rhynchosporium graminicola]
MATLNRSSRCSIVDSQRRKEPVLRSGQTLSPPFSSSEPRPSPGPGQPKEPPFQYPDPGHFTAYPPSFSKPERTEVHFPRSTPLDDDDYDYDYDYNDSDSDIDSKDKARDFEGTRHFLLSQPVAYQPALLELADPDAFEPDNRIGFVWLLSLPSLQELVSRYRIYSRIRGHAPGPL